jgi:hypothetical protein
LLGSRGRSFWAFRRPPCACDRRGRGAVPGTCRPCPRGPRGARVPHPCRSCRGTALPSPNAGLVRTESSSYEHAR